MKIRFVMRIFYFCDILYRMDDELKKTETEKIANEVIADIAEKDAQENEKEEPVTESSETEVSKEAEELEALVQEVTNEFKAVKETEEEDADEEPQKPGGALKKTLTALVIVILIAVVGFVLIHRASNSRTQMAVNEIVYVSESTPTPTPTIEAEPLFTELTTSQEVLDAITNAESKENEIVTSDNYVMDDAVYEELLAATKEIEDNEYSIGYVLTDISTGVTVTYNADEEFYSASTIKAFFVTSLLDSRPELVDSAYTDAMMRALIYSDNASYETIRYAFHGEYIANWYEAAGIDTAKSKDMYPNYSARAMALLWELNYNWFETNELGEEVASWYETPNNGVFYKLVDEDTTTRTKGGWIYEYSSSGELYSNANDGGIITVNGHSFIMTLMSDCPADFTMLERVAGALLTVQQDMMTQIEAELN